MPWFVSDHEEDDVNNKFYEDYDVAAALADFFERASKNETANLKWSY